MARRRAHARPRALREIHRGDCLELFREHVESPQLRIPDDERIKRRRARAAEVPADLLRAVVLLDPPDHDRLRRVVRGRFTPAGVAAMETAIGEQTAERFARLRLVELDTFRLLNSRFRWIRPPDQLGG